MARDIKAVVGGRQEGVKHGESRGVGRQRKGVGVGRGRDGGGLGIQDPHDPPDPHDLK